MVDAKPSNSASRRPLGGWPSVYALVCVLALLVMLALWWFTSHYNVRLPRS